MIVSIELVPCTSKRKWFGAHMIRSPARETGGDKRQIFWWHEDSETQDLLSFTLTVIFPISVLKDLETFLSREIVSILRPSLNTETNLPHRESKRVVFKEAIVKQEECP